MPLDAIGYLPQRVLTEDEARDLAVLKAARHRIRHRWRWWRGQGRLAFPGTYCALTAVAATVAANGDRAQAVVQRLTVNLPPGWSCVMALNDDPSTTHADILALYDRAIAELE